MKLRDNFIHRSLLIPTGNAPETEFNDHPPFEIFLILGKRNNKAHKKTQALIERTCGVIRMRLSFLNNKSDVLYLNHVIYVSSLWHLTGSQDIEVFVPALLLTH